jgi:hypothetical protein
MSVFVRIFLRWAAGFLIAKGIFSESDANLITSDPELAAMLEMGLGAALGALAEGWYALARRLGWSK